MTNLNRRHILSGLSFLGASSLLEGTAFAQNIQNKARIVIIGGGFGGATAAMTLKKYAPNFDITLVEPKTSYYACPFSNLVIGGVRDTTAQSFTYAGLKALGIQVVHALAGNINSNLKTVTLSDKTSRPYDKLILSPGISMQMDSIDGYDAETKNRMPHAWTGGSATAKLAKQITDMGDGGTVVISVPAAPYRCPPGPYERASLIAHYLKYYKPKSKLIILDAKDSFSKQDLFQDAWAELYPNIIEWRGASNDGRVIKVDARENKVFTDFETLTPDVANIIPPQRAGIIAEQSGLTDISGWCPIDPIDFRSTLKKDIYVIGDATIAAPMPKSAFSAAVQAKICALQILREFSGRAPIPTTLTNTCYSFIDPEHAISITGVYSNADQRLTTIPNSGGLSPRNARKSGMLSEAHQARDWFRSMSYNAFGDA